MGTKPAPPYANIFMARNIDEKLWKIAEKYIVNGEIPMKHMKRFLDDIFFVFLGSIEKLHLFLDEINTIHPTIKFTMSHTTPNDQELASNCSCQKVKSIPYLDTSCEIKAGKIVTDLYRKPTDKNQYLLTSSCHPAECLQSIPKSLCTRINRICMEEATRDQRLQELKDMLLAREYTPGVIDSAIAKARATPRHVALRRVPRQDTNNRPAFVVCFDPRLPSIPNITKKHWRSMASEDKYLESVFPQPPLVFYKRRQNIREKIIWAKVAPERQQRSKKGMFRCGKCLACSYIKEGKTVNGRDFKNKRFTWKIGKEGSCESKNIVYLLECEKEYCKQKYIGTTQQEFRDRIYQHIGYVRNKQISKATGEHFNLPGHRSHHMKFTILEKVKSLDPLYGREREKLLIRKFNTFYNGINKEP